jgi:hypothetical protein
MIEYPGHYLVTRVTTVATFRVKTKLLVIANALRSCWIGMDEEGDGIWSVYFGSILPAKLDEGEMIIRACLGLHTKCHLCPRLGMSPVSRAVQRAAELRTTPVPDARPRFG